MNAKSLLICLGALGDFLLALPLLRGLSDTGPLVVLSRGSYRALLPADLENLYFVDIHSGWASLLFAGEAALPASMRNMFAQATAHAMMKPDIMLEHALVKAGIKSIVWHNPRPQSPPHVSIQFLQTAGISVPPSLTDGMLEGVTRSPGSALWLHPGSGSPAKNLDIELFAQAARFWQSRGKDQIIVSFGEADLPLRPAMENALSSMGVKAEVVVMPSLQELRSMLAENAELFIGADTGVTHLAACVGVPVIVGFRCTDPRIWHPLGNHRIFLADALDVRQTLLTEVKNHLEHRP